MVCRPRSRRHQVPDRVVYRLLDVLDRVSVDLLDLLSVVVGRTELEEASVLEIVLDLLPDLPDRSQCVVAHANALQAPLLGASGHRPRVTKAAS